MPSMTCVKTADQHGRSISRLLRGAWRGSPPGLDHPAHALEEIAPILVELGAGALAWKIVARETGIGSRVLSLLRQAYRFHTLQAELLEDGLLRMLARLRAAGVEPVILKGWSVARLYPESGLRPYGDLDILAPSQHYGAARHVASTCGSRCAVDLHARLADLPDRSTAELYARSVVTRLRGTEVRLLSAEDQLRYLCLHMLRHGVRRPLWLCDVAAALEALPPDFDWGYCLSGDRRRSRWVLCGLGLAQRLLGACPERPWPGGDVRLPVWLEPAVLRQWGMGAPVPASRGASPGALLAALRSRWPNPIKATVHRGGAFNDFPRPPYQVAELIAYGVRRLGRRREDRSDPAGRARECGI
jgi:hypothetical protein